MILDFDLLVKKHNLKVSGIIHIGAHLGTEYKIYKKHKIDDIIFFEPNPETFKKLAQNILKYATSNAEKTPILSKFALGNKKGIFDFNVSSNNGASSSILKPKKHLERHPNIKFGKTIQVEMRRLDDIRFDRQLYNMINIDVQGYELEVFKGSANTLHFIDYIMAEVNRDEVYENCVQIDELDKFLHAYGFIRKETNWAGGIWGDAFYVKKL